MDRESARVVELDVRPQLRNKLEPFQLIMDQVESLGEDDVFVLHATIRPTPLIGMLKLKGLVGISERVDDNHWMTTFVNKKNEQWIKELTSLIDASDTTDSNATSQNQECRGHHK
jgi:hypothetical protein